MVENHESMSILSFNIVSNEKDKRITETKCTHIYLTMRISKLRNIKAIFRNKFTHLIRGSNQIKLHTYIQLIFNTPSHYWYIYFRRKSM